MRVELNAVVKQNVGVTIVEVVSGHKKPLHIYWNNITNIYYFPLLYGLRCISIRCSVFAIYIYCMRVFCVCDITVHLNVFVMRAFMCRML